MNGSSRATEDFFLPPTEPASDMREERHNTGITSPADTKDGKVLLGKRRWANPDKQKIEGEAYRFNSLVELERMVSQTSSLGANLPARSFTRRRFLLLIHIPMRNGRTSELYMGWADKARCAVFDKTP